MFKNLDSTTNLIQLIKKYKQNCFEKGSHFDNPLSVNI